MRFTRVFGCLISAAAAALSPAHAQTSPTAPPAPADLPALIRANVKLQPPATLDGAQVSPLRTTAGPQLGDAMLCLKAPAGGSVVVVAVFLENAKVLSYRRAVAFDRCGVTTYAPLAPPPQAKPAPRKHAPRV